MLELENKKLVVLVERHLEQESQLAQTLNELNDALSATFATSGLKGPTTNGLADLAPYQQQLHDVTARVYKSRQRLVERISLETQFGFATLREFIGSLSEPDRTRLETIRESIVSECARAQSELIQNQTSLYYTFDFHRRYLCGVIGCENQSESYGPGGVSSDVPRGNLYGRTC